MVKKLKRADEIAELLQSYLDDIINRWDEAGGNTPTLPLTNDGKVNVTELVKELNLKAHDAQYFYRNRDLADTINIVADMQGVLPIGSRKLDSESDEAIKAKLVQMKVTGKKSGDELIDALHRIDLLTQENHGLILEIDGLKAQIQSIYSNGDVLIRGDV